MIEMSKKLACQFLDNGIKEGDNIPVLLSNTVAFPGVLMALLYIKSNPILINVTSNIEDLIRLREEVEFDFFIHDYIDITSRIHLESSNCIWKTSVGNVMIYIMPIFLNVVSKKNRESQLHTSIQLKGVVLHLTSGTSGKARVCVRNQKVAVEEALNFLSEIDLFHSDANILITTPLNHAFAYGFGLVTSIVSNSILWLDINFNPRKVIRILSNEHIDILGIVPSMINLLLQASEKLQMFSMAKAIFYAGAACTQKLKVEFEKTYGKKLYAIYGTTETGTIATTYSKKNIDLFGVGQIYRNVTIFLDKKVEESKI